MKLAALTRIDLSHELELFQAFRKAGIDDATAQAAVESINREIDERYSLQAAQRFAKADAAQLEAELVKRCVGAISASAAVYGAIFKLLH